MPAKNIIEQIPSANRAYRQQATNYFLTHPEEIDELLHLTFNPAYSYHHKAAWILEFVAFKDFNLFSSYLNFFIKSLPLISKDSAVRPVAKITHLIVQNFISYNKPENFHLSDTQIQTMITAGFDWLIGNYRVATKVQAMQIVFELGQLPATGKWVLTELKYILLENMNLQTAGYQNRAGKILKQLEKI